MKSCLIILISIQLSVLGIAVAQITFTREWVTGKRSGVPKVQVMMHEDEASFCKSLVPAIDYLLEAEKARERLCGPSTKAAVPYSIVWGKPMHQGESSNIGGSQDPVMEEVAPYERHVMAPIRKST